MLINVSNTKWYYYVYEKLFIVYKLLILMVNAQELVDECQDVLSDEEQADVDISKCLKELKD